MTFDLENEINRTLECLNLPDPGEPGPHFVNRVCSQLPQVRHRRTRGRVLLPAAIILMTTMNITLLAAALYNRSTSSVPTNDSAAVIAGEYGMASIDLLF